MEQTPVTQDDPTDHQPTDDAPGSGRRSVVWIMLFFAAAVIALLVIQYAAPPHDTGMEQAGVGHPLPDLQLQPLTGDGRAVQLGDLAGKVVLLDFWGTWCPPCRAELPHIAALADGYRDRPDFQLLAVSCGADSEEPKSLKTATQEFLTDRKLDIATYYDPQGFTRFQIDKIAGFDGYPTTLVLDRKGVIRGLWAGYEPGTERQIGALVAKLLAETPSK